MPLPYYMKPSQHLRGKESGAHHRVVSTVQPGSATNRWLYPCPPPSEGGCGARRYERCHTFQGTGEGSYIRPMEAIHKVRPRVDKTYPGKVD